MSKLIRPNEIYNLTTAVERIAIDQLVRPDKALRVFTKHIVRLAARQVEQFGLFVPLLVDQNNKVIGGILYLLAAQYLGLTEVPVVRVTHLSDEQIRTYRIAEQRLQELPRWDQKVLAEELKFLAALDLDFDLDITGFSTTEIDLHIAGLNDENISNEDEGLTPLRAVAVTEPGDRWKLNRHHVICGSALDRSVWTALFGNKFASLVFTDPPYNVKIDGHVSGNGQIVHREFAMATGEMTTEAYRDFLRSVLQNAHDHSSDGSLHHVCIDWRHIDDVLAVGRPIYNDLINVCCWVKPNAGMGSFYRSRHELIPVFRKGKKSHRNNIELGRHGRNRSNVWEYAGATTFAGRTTDEGNTLAMHPTVKPVNMVADAILDSTARNEIVADPFLGSGATLMAAERIGRRLHGIELDPLYVDVAIRRWQKQTGQDAIHVASGKTFRELETAGVRADV
ncbi:MAG: DNA modification methylase [Afipia sp.]